MLSKKVLSIFLLIIFFVTALLSFSATSGETAAYITVPAGFSVSVYARNLKGAREMSFAEDGTLFVGSNAGKVYAVKRDGTVVTIASGLDDPAGIAWFHGTLFVTEISRLIRFDNILQTLGVKNGYSVVTDDFPSYQLHGWKFIRFGPDGKMYMADGSPCNVCVAEDKRFGTILRMNPDGTDIEIFASGIRNSVGFDWDPGSGDLWFTDNGRDYLGDDSPPDELNHAVSSGLNFGFPYLFGKNVKDPIYWTQQPANSSFTAPAWELPAHVAPLGMRFYTGNEFPTYYLGGVFIAEHGSWNRSSKIGYRVSFVRINGGVATGYEVFAFGWLKNEQVSGRPADVEIGPDGALYVSDDYLGTVYRIVYSGYSITSFQSQ